MIAARRLPTQYPEAKQHHSFFRVVYEGIDITEYTIRASYQELATTMAQLDVSFEHSEDLLKFIKMSGNIVFYGADTGTNNYSQLFNGIVRQIKSDYQESGEVFLTVIALLHIGTALYLPKNYTYPEIPSPGTREFAVQHIRNTVTGDYTDGLLKEGAEIYNEIALLPSPKAPMNDATRAAALVNYFTKAKNAEAKAAVAIGDYDKAFKIYRDLSSENRRFLSLHLEYRNYYIDYLTIIKGIADENNFSYREGIVSINPTIVLPEIPIELQPTLEKPSVQEAMTDIAYLNRLANSLACSFWLEDYGGGLTMYFMDKRLLSKPRDNTTGVAVNAAIHSNLVFFAPLRTKGKYSDGGRLPNDRNNGDLLIQEGFVREPYPYKYSDRKKNTLLELARHRERSYFQLSNVTVTEDYGLVDAVRPRASIYNEHAGISSSIDSTALHTVVDISDLVSRGVINESSPAFNSTLVYIENKEHLVLDHTLIEKDAYGNVKYRQSALDEIGIKESDISSDKLKNLSPTALRYEDALDERAVSETGLTIPELDVLNTAIKTEKVNPNDPAASSLLVKSFGAKGMGPQTPEYYSKEAAQLLFRKYWKRAYRPIDKDIFTQPFEHRGVRVSATCDFDVRIKTLRFYRIEGIIRYGSDVDSELFMLRSLTHTFDEKGTETKLEFFK